MCTTVADIQMLTETPCQLDVTLIHCSFVLQEIKPGFCLTAMLEHKWKGASGY